MSNERSRSARRVARRLLLAVAVVGALGAQAAQAATARVSWLPSAGATVAGYSVYVRDAASPYAAQPQWSGNPAPTTDGSFSALVTFTPAAAGANYFAVVAIGSAGESALSRELPTGTPNPCRIDSCAAKAACDFRALPDGASCDDASFCNGAEVCRGGVCDTSATRDCADPSACTVDACDEATDTCTHVATPGCCLACDSGDPCLADACAAGDCTASPGLEIAVQRMRFTTRAAGTKLSFKGTFAAETDLDPSSTGAVIEMRTADGAVLYAAALAAPSFTASASGRRQHFRAAGAVPDPLWNGLERLDFRRKGAKWLVSAEARAAELAEAARESSITWVIRLGTTCARRLDAACEPGSARTICR